MSAPVASLPVTLDTMIAEVERELEMRRRVYPGLVFNRKLRQSAADFQVANMERIVEVLQAVRDWTRTALNDSEAEGLARVKIAIAAAGRAKG